MTMDPTRLVAQLDALDVRVQRLEEELFGSRGPSGGLGALLRQFDERLQEIEHRLMAAIASHDKEYDEKLDEAIKTLAELQATVKGLKRSAQVKVRTGFA